MEYLLYALVFADAQMLSENGAEHAFERIEERIQRMYSDDYSV